jgi:uncharacterized protein YrrD
MTQKLRKLGELVGYHLHATDGEIGELVNVYYDDKHWTVRYFIVHTGNWLNGKDVLIPPPAIIGVDDKNKCLDVSLTREQVENSPPVDTAKPVSRYYEEEYHRYYNWEPYWVSDPLFWSSSTAAIQEADKERKPMEHPNLRSCKEVQGYHIHALDGAIGHVEDAILDSSNWSVRYFEISTRNWLPGKHILMSPVWAHSIDWATETVTVNVKCEAIKSAPAYHQKQIIDNDYEKALAKHYGMEARRK